MLVNWREKLERQIPRIEETSEHSTLDGEQFRRLYRIALEKRLSKIAMPISSRKKGKPGVRGVSVRNELRKKWRNAAFEFLHELQHILDVEHNTSGARLHKFVSTERPSVKEKKPDHVEPAEVTEMNGVLSEHAKTSSTKRKSKAAGTRNVTGPSFAPSASNKRIKPTHRARRDERAAPLDKSSRQVQIQRILRTFARQTNPIRAVRLAVESSYRPRPHEYREQKGAQATARLLDMRRRLTNETQTQLWEQMQQAGAFEGLDGLDLASHDEDGASSPTSERRTRGNTSLSPQAAKELLTNIKELFMAPKESTTSDQDDSASEEAADYAALEAAVNAVTQQSEDAVPEQSVWSPSRCAISPSVIFGDLTLQFAAVIMFPNAHYRYRME
ncbi:hypothetical protein LTR37_002434 [Vermiconidia calcicola]|uniref:Uncharacterized protein n=1 Tax=Vermiconidia calcicola TaxID=1690605 RepID=A0ACC3NT08_9PEZI|nr:hypothetical protein LTR37_002434 [Vermiconidia calcicola]